MFQCNVCERYVLCYQNHVISPLTFLSWHIFFRFGWQNTENRSQQCIHFFPSTFRTNTEYIHNSPFDHIKPFKHCQWHAGVRASFSHCFFLAVFPFFFNSSIFMLFLSLLPFSLLIFILFISTVYIYSVSVSVSMLVFDSMGKQLKNVKKHVGRKSWM